MRFLLLLLLSFNVAAASVTCTGNVDSAAINLTCTESGTPTPTPPNPNPTPPTPLPPSGCSTPYYQSSFPNSGTFKDFSLPMGAVASIALPTFTYATWAENLVFQSTGTPSDLLAEAAIAPCTGSFDVPPECKQSGNAWSSIDLWSWTPPQTGYCKREVGVTYYLNVRNTNCALNSCPMRAQYFGGKQ